MRGLKMGQLLFSHLHQLCCAGKGERKYQYPYKISVPSSVHLNTMLKLDIISWSKRLQRPSTWAFSMQKPNIRPIPMSPYFCLIFYTLFGFFKPPEISAILTTFQCYSYSIKNSKYFK